MEVVPKSAKRNKDDKVSTCFVGQIQTDVRIVQSCSFFYAAQEVNDRTHWIAQNCLVVPVPNCDKHSLQVLNLRFSAQFCTLWRFDAHTIRVVVTNVFVTNKKPISFVGNEIWNQIWKDKDDHQSKRDKVIWSSQLSTINRRVMGSIDFLQNEEKCTSVCLFLEQQKTKMSHFLDEHLFHPQNSLSESAGNTCCQNKRMLLASSKFKQRWLVQMTLSQFFFSLSTHRSFSFISVSRSCLCRRTLIWGKDWFGVKILKKCDSSRDSSVDSCKE